ITATHDRIDALREHLDTTPATTQPITTGTAASLEGLIDEGAVVHNHFAVGDHLEGWDISFKDNRNVYYTTADGDYLLIGAVLDAQGNNVSAQHQARLPGQTEPAPQPVQPARRQPNQPDQDTLQRIYAQL